MVLIKRGGGTGPMKPDNQHSHLNALVSIPTDLYLKDKKTDFLRDFFCIDVKLLFLLKSSFFIFKFSDVTGYFIIKSYI